MMESVYIIAAIITLLVLVSASVSDWKKREVSDIHWLILFIIGTAVLLVRYGSDPLPTSFAALMFILISADLIWDREPTLKSESLLITGIIMSATMVVRMSWGTDLAQATLTVFAVFFVMNILYYTGIVRGGADAKCVIAISMVFPLYPVFGEFPLVMSSSDPFVTVFPFAVAVFIVADVLAVSPLFYYLARNLIKGDRKFPQMLIGYVKPISSVDEEKEWPIQDIIDGEVVIRTRPADDGAVQRLKGAGAENIWVTPIIPFIIPLTVAYVIVLLIGNPFFLIL